MVLSFYDLHSFIHVYPYSNNDEGEHGKGSWVDEWVAKREGVKKVQIYVYTQTHRHRQSRRPKFLVPWEVNRWRGVGNTQ